MVGDNHKPFLCALMMQILSICTKYSLKTYILLAKMRNICDIAWQYVEKIITLQPSSRGILLKRRYAA